MSKRFQKLLSRLRHDQLVLIFVILILVLAFTVLALLNYSTFDPQIGRYRKALQREAYAEAGRYFSEDIRGDLELERAAQGLVVRQIEALKEDYVEGEIDEQTMNAALEEMRQAKLLSGTELIDMAQADVDVLTRSLEAFEQAREAELSGDIAEAIRLYAQVQLLDPHYEETQVRLTELRGRYIRQAEAEIDELIADAAFAKAMTAIDQGECLLPGERTWSEKRSEVRIHQERASIQSILDLSAEDRQNKLYEKALTRLKQATEIYPDNVDILQAYLDTRTAIENDLLLQARNAWAGGDREQALLILEGGLELIADSPYLVTWQRIYEATSPEIADDDAGDSIEDEGIS